MLDMAGIGLPGLLCHGPVAGAGGYAAGGLHCSRAVAHPQIQARRTLGHKVPQSAADAHKCPGGDNPQGPGEVSPPAAVHEYEGEVNQNAQGEHAEGGPGRPTHPRSHLGVEELGDPVADLLSHSLGGHSDDGAVLRGLGRAEVPGDDTDVGGIGQALHHVGNDFVDVGGVFMEFLDRQFGMRAHSGDELAAELCGYVGLGAVAVLWTLACGNMLKGWAPPAAAQQAVGRLIRGLLLLQAAQAALLVQPGFLIAAALLAAWPLNRRLAKRFAPS